MTFASFNLHPHLLSQVTAIGYKTPTPIQRQSIPTILEGKDFMGLAQTGTGKTAAFVLPMLQRLMQGPRGRIRGLIIAPTRELAQQTHEAIGKLAQLSGLRSAAFYGGVNINPQKRQLQRGIDIAVACPGRLLDLHRQGTIDFSGVEMLVLDEADQMFDMGFFPTTRQILQLLPRKRQSLLFSATMPKDVRKLANEILFQPVTVQIETGIPVQSVTQVLFPVSQNQKTDLLLKILKDTELNSTLIFTRTKQRAERLTEQLIESGYQAASLQGNLSQNLRQRVLGSFRTGKLPFLVATDIASRGIDTQISHVINFDMPDTVEAYTHRIGRTGRAAKLGDAYSLVTREDIPKVRAIEKVMNITLEQRILDDFAYKASSSSSRDKKPGSAHRPAPKNKGRPHVRRQEAKADPGSNPGAARRKHPSSTHNQFYKSPPKWRSAAPNKRGRSHKNDDK